jgi:1-deoxy-D-xylulose-5-phosphate reductoisomerase
LAWAALRQGGRLPTLLNAANEVAVAAFLDGRIGFLDIADTVSAVLDTVPDGALDSLEDVLEADAAARRAASARIATGVAA